MSKSQSSNVDGRCDGVEISTRDQKGEQVPRQSEGSVSLEYIISVEYLFGEAMSWVGWWKIY